MAQENTDSTQDLELLMLSKSFDKLNAQEQAFVLQHFESEEEYQSMRMMLLNIIEINEERAQIKPKEKIRKELLAKFRNKNNRKSAWWSNLIPFSTSFSAIRILIPAAVVLIVAIVLINPLLNSEENVGRIAENQIGTEKNERVSTGEEIATESVTVQENTPEENNSVEELEADLELEELELSENLTNTIVSSESASEENIFLNDDVTFNTNSGATYSLGETTLSVVESAKTTSFSSPAKEREAMEKSEAEMQREVVSASDYKQLLGDLYTSY